MRPDEKQTVLGNETGFAITYNQIAMDNSDTTVLFQIPPYNEVIVETSGESNEEVNADNCCNGLLGDLQGSGFPILLIFDGLRCITYSEGEGRTTTNINSYDSRSLSKKHFQYTYTFTHQIYDDASACK